LVKGPQVFNTCVRERGLKNSRKETKEEILNAQVFPLLFHYLFSAIWVDFCVFENKSNLP
jgi:hypothetical protein